ncbi:MAG TPA: hypothetical protein VL282_04310 [Tepidisphaeraceae bacterium]|jgi:hypothetical protein|nr:hypothetical protein [Tepidisphaeraceae bacterium]
MDRTKHDVAQHLAEAHFRVEPQILRIFRLVAPEQTELEETEPVKLLEVNPDTPKNGIIPVYFAAHPASGAFYPSIIVEIHPEEFIGLQSRTLTLPHNWTIANEFAPPKRAESA